MTDWRSVPMSEICDITRGASPRPINDWISSTGTPWVKIADATRSSGRTINETRECILDSGRQHSVVVRPGDLILSNSATPGIPKFMGIEACIHDGWMLLRNFREALPEFLYYRLLADRPALVGLGNGSVFTNLKTDILKSHVIELPPLAEQRRIAEVLGALDDLIEVNRELVRGLDDVGRAAFALAISAGANQARIGDIASVASGKFLNKDARGTGAIPVIGSNGRIATTTNATELEPVVVVGRVGACGQVALTEGPAWVSDNALVIKPRFEHNASLLFWLLKSVDFGPLVQGTTQPMIRGGDVADLVVSVPDDLAVQEALADLVLAQRALMAEVDMLASVRDELLPLLISGRVRVSEAVAA